MNLVDILKACADETRIDILRALGRHSELCVTDLVAACGVSQPKVSRHLAYLRREALVSDRKEGLNVYYRLVTLSDPDSNKVVSIVARRTPAEMLAPDEEVPLPETRYEELDVELL